MSVKFGIDGKLYFCAAGISGTPAWTEITNVKNVALNVTSGETDVTVRGNNGWKAIAPTLKEASIEFEMIWDTTDTGFTAASGAFFNKTTLGLAVMDGPVATAGSQGLWANCYITGFSRDENNEGAMTVKVTAKPAYSATAPLWKTVAA